MNQSPPSQVNVGRNRERGPKTNRQSQNPKKAPDPRRCNVTLNGHLDWHSNVSINFEVLALDGSICKDRVSFSFDDRDSVENFELSFTGQDSRLRAMASITGVVQ